MLVMKSTVRPMHTEKALHCQCVIHSGGDSDSDGAVRAPLQRK